MNHSLWKYIKCIVGEWDGADGPYDKTGPVLQPRYYVSSPRAKYCTQYVVSR